MAAYRHLGRLDHINSTTRYKITQDGGTSWWGGEGCGAQGQAGSRAGTRESVGTWWGKRDPWGWLLGSWRVWWDWEVGGGGLERSMVVVGTWGDGALFLPPPRTRAFFSLSPLTSLTLRQITLASLPPHHPFWLPAPLFTLTCSALGIGECYWNQNWDQPVGWRVFCGATVGLAGP